MSTDFKLKKHIWLLPFAAFLIFSFILFCRYASLSSDDLYYVNDLKRYSLGSWCRDFYLNWGGRVPLLLLDVIFLNLPFFVWKLFMACIYTLIPFYIFRIAALFVTDKKQKKQNQMQTAFILSLASVIMTFLLPYTLVEYSSLSETSSFNYPFPCAMFLIGIYPFAAAVNGTQTRKSELAAAYIGTFFCCYFEQNAAVYLVLSGIVLLWAVVSARPCKHTLIPLFLWGLLNSVIMFAAPGNQERMQSEVMLWNPSFDMLGMPDKILLGFIHFMSYTYRHGFYLFLTAAICLIVLSWRKGIFCRISAFFLLLTSLVVYSFSGRIDDTLFTDIYDYRKLAALSLMLFWMLMLIWFTASMIPDLKTGLCCSLLTAGSIASGLIMGFSPSIFASTERVFFLSFILLILAVSILLGTTVRSLRIKNQIL